MQIEKSNLQIDKVKITRFRFSIAQKVELLDLMKKGTPRTEICRTYNIPSSTLHQFLKDEARIRDEFEKNRDPNRQMIRQSPFHELEQALMQWIGAVQERNIPINGPIVQEKALEFAECMGLKDFSASGGWLDRFKKRENIDFKGRNSFLCDESSSSARIFFANSSFSPKPFAFHNISLASSNLALSLIMRLFMLGWVRIREFVRLWPCIYIYQLGLFVLLPQLISLNVVPISTGRRQST